MAAFAAAVKIDSFAYMPVQDFGNAFSTFVAQNYGAGKHERIRAGYPQRRGRFRRLQLRPSACWCIGAGAPADGAVHRAGGRRRSSGGIGVVYLRIEGAFYVGIGLLFLLYGFYRAVGKPAMSVVLTVASLGTRVALAYTLSAVPGHRRGGHLVVGAHRLVSGGRHRLWVLLCPLPRKRRRLGRLPEACKTPAVFPGKPWFFLLQFQIFCVIHGNVIGNDGENSLKRRSREGWPPAESRPADALLGSPRSRHGDMAGCPPLPGFKCAPQGRKFGWYRGSKPFVPSRDGGLFCRPPASVRAAYL